MSFAEAEQTDRAESFASDISWTYSLDLVDSLKPPHFFSSLRFEGYVLPHGMKKKAMAQEAKKQKKDGLQGL